MSENEAKNSSNIVGYDGKCCLCGSGDGTIIKGSDGRYRNMCRVFGCKAWYLHCPATGFDTIEEVRNPFDSNLIKRGCTNGFYLYGKTKSVTGLQPDIEREQEQAE